MFVDPFQPRKTRILSQRLLAPRRVLRGYHNAPEHPEPRAVDLAVLCYAARACRNLLPASMGQSMDAFSTALRCLQLHCVHGTCSVCLHAGRYLANASTV